VNFKELLLQAKNGSEVAAVEILNLYKPLLLKESLTGGIFDEDLCQELCVTLINCIHKFHI